MIPKGRLVDNYAIDATAGAPFTTDKLYKPTVPVGKRWYFYGGTMNRDVSSTMAAVIKNADDEVVHQLSDYAAATTIAAIPDTVAQVNTYGGGFPIIMDAGWYFQVSFATSQTGGCQGAMPVIEVDA